jgi:hypothetical protein
MRTYYRRVLDGLDDDAISGLFTFDSFESELVMNIDTSGVRAKLSNCA